MGKISFNANESSNEELEKELYEEIKDYCRVLKEAKDKNAIKNAIVKVSELKKQQKEINDSKYVPSPYDSTVEEKTKTHNFGKTKVKFSNDTVSSPFVQCNPITINTILKASREISGFGRARHDKYSVVGEGGLIKMYMYIVSILKKDSNFIKLDKERVMQYTGVGTNGYAEYLRILNRLNVLAEIKNMRSCYVINHNVIYNGDKIMLCEWLNKGNKVELKKDENKNYTYVEIDENNKTKLNNIFKNTIFEPFEEAKIE